MERLYKAARVGLGGCSPFEELSTRVELSLFLGLGSPRRINVYSFILYLGLDFSIRYAGYKPFYGKEITYADSYSSETIFKFCASLSIHLCVHALWITLRFPVVNSIRFCARVSAVAPS